MMVRKMKVSVSRNFQLGVLLKLYSVGFEQTFALCHV